ncbi:phospholipase D-like domain-containing protein [Nonomuraea sp. 3-1Str]|uniref:phospholipase D family protein n=1 Tax=Nonomuraea sp. 3-1Str TaxID=2929801 RepID=UPI002861D786|nr:phospholipase D-like domain-containing protein [Nonomuraea sp. 3-1Str]MDR8408179.1 phospholipase D-like domain-containing protein [Nonomuraea sp. 3-1Str]
MDFADWFLTQDERDNPATRLGAWTTGNLVRPLIHGATYFAELKTCLDSVRAHDLVLFADWRGDPDERLADGGPQISEALSGAAARGALVNGLIWRSHLDALRFSAEENRHLGEKIEAAGGQAVLDTRVRPGGAHHQKFVVIRRRDDPDHDVTFVGGVDLCHSRRDDAAHHGDPQAAPMPDVYGDSPPWHDVQVAIHGPAVAEVETVFRERWEDPAPETRQPFRRLRDHLERMDDVPALPPPGPAPGPAGTHAVQLLRTYPYRRRPYPFAPRGERSVARAYQKVLRRARSLVYLEDQYLWSTEVIEPFAEALEREEELRMIIVVPRHPDQDGWLAGPASLIGRSEALRRLKQAGGDRVAVYDLENHAGTPVYVHAKVCVVDDVWASVGSDNVNLRSWTYDSELSCAVVDEEPDPRPPAGGRRFARELRLTLAAEHLDRDPDDVDDLCDPKAAFEALAESARRLDAWHRDGRRGPRPPGRLRPHPAPELGRVRKLLAMPLYRVAVDPDGRPSDMRRSRRF